MTEDTFSITVEGLSTHAESGLLLGLANTDEDVSLQRDVTIGNLTQERAETLIAELLNVEEELSESGRHDEAQAVDRLGREIETQLQRDHL